VSPLRPLLILLALLLLPAAALSNRLDAQARASVLHVLLSFGVLMLAFRLIGKRELSRLSPFELVTLMLIPEIMSNSVQGQGAVLTSLAGLCTVLFLVVSVSVLSQRFPAVQKLLEAEPTVLVLRGRLLADNMNRERIAPDELFGEMRKQGIAALEEVRFAVLEPGGEITFVSSTKDGERRRESAPLA
jgi:uncharacterized membrane protein YcaP (DUF421 family)